VTTLSPDKRALLAKRLRAAVEQVGAGEQIGAGEQGEATARARRPRRTIPVRPKGTAPPLSHAQQRLWFLEQVAPGSGQLTIPLALRVRGQLDAGWLAGALNAATSRHEALRMRFPVNEDGEPRVIVAAEADMPLRTAEADGERAATDLVGAFLAEAFALAAGPVARALLVRLAADDHVLAIALHHIVADGWSADLLVREIFDGAPASDPLGYGDYAAWQRGTEQSERPGQSGQPDPAGALGADLEYWHGQLAGAEPLDLPVSRPRPPVQTYGGAAQPFTLDAGLAGRLGELARAHGATLYMTLLAAFAALLGRYAGSVDVTVGTPAAGRPLPELEDVVGCFLNMLAMRTDLSGDPTFGELLTRVRNIALDAYAHQQLPFEGLVADLDLPRDTSRPPLFTVLFALQNYGGTGPGGSPTPPGLSVAPFPIDRWSTRYDLELYVGQGNDGLPAMFIYNTDLFDADTIARLAGHLETLLRQVADRPGQRLSEIDLLTRSERRLVLSQWNATATQFPGAGTLHGPVERQAARTPAATAVRFTGARLSYLELNAAANRVAHTLRAQGAGPGTLVAICADRSLELAAALLGVLKSGAAYLPVDPGYPADRVAFMLRDAAAPLLLTQAALAGDLPPTAARVLLLDDLLPGNPPLHGAGAWADAPETDPDPAAGPDDIAYVIYTSGSTGRPKGVPNTHRGIANRLDWMQRQYALRPGDVVLQKTPVSFDVSVWELFWPLREGARLALAVPDGHRDPAYLRELIAAEGVTTAHFVPSMLAAFLAQDDLGGCAGLRTVLCSGEELPADLARRCTARLPSAALHNLYGPTEAAIDVSAWACDPATLAGASRVPIGRPIANTALYVLGTGMRPEPPGVPGELHIGGVGLATGYLNRPALTADRFVPDPFGPPGGRLYRTGDLACWRADGSLEFLGRLDSQVKLRGQRIELGEIEAALRALPGVRDAAANVREDRPGDKRLVGYVTGDNPAALPDQQAARTELKKTLPDYMVPPVLVTLDKLPLTPSGKLDRKALPPPATGTDIAPGERVPPGTDTERVLAGIWAELLGVPEVGVTDDFFDLGGHSLLATQVVARLKRELGHGVSVLDVFKHPTVRELAAVADTPEDQRGPRQLLNLLTRPSSSQVGAPTLSLVCVPYGGGSAVVYQPLADALPPGCALWSVAAPGHDVGVTEDALPFDELAAGCVREIRQKVHGPVVLYGHCALGSALTVEIARRLEGAGREVEAVYIGAIFPFARPGGGALSLVSRVREALTGSRPYLNWLISLGVEVSDLDPEQARRFVANMRRDAKEAEEYFTGLLGAAGISRLRAPVIAVVGSEDPSTDYYAERFREWHFLSPDCAVVVLDEAGHYFLKYRADELADIVTGTHRALSCGQSAQAGSLAAAGREPGAAWWLHAVSHADPEREATGRSESKRKIGPERRTAVAGPEPSMRRFLWVAGGQLVSATGSALTGFAVPLWVYLSTRSVAVFGLMAVVGLVPGLLAAPFAGAVTDRASRRRVMLAGDGAAAACELVFALLAWTGRLRVPEIYLLLACLSVALTFQRIAYASAVPQLVPKHFLGHANGVVQLAFGTAQLLVPVIAVGLVATIGLKGILTLDMASYALAIGVVLAVRFPQTMPWRPREPLLTEMAGGLRYSLGNPGLVAMLGYFVVLNIFLSPLFLMISPLVLSFASLGDVGWISFAAGLGAFAAALIMIAWGGPGHRRMHGMLVSALLLGGCCLVTGVRPSLIVVAAGTCGMGLCLTLLNSIYATIVQVKVPQRFHGRVFALNTLIAWSTLPIGFAVVAPYGARLLNPLLVRHGALANSVGTVLGTGPGRGIGLMYLLFALAIGVITVTAMRVPALARFDDSVPDAEPDDLVGIQALRRRAEQAPADKTEAMR
jgi:amino acid adenylation domain-containing protein